MFFPPKQLYNDVPQGGGLPDTGNLSWHDIYNLEREVRTTSDYQF